MSLKEWIGLVSVAISPLGYVPYFRDLLSRKTKPHAFSWLVWGLLTGISFAGQIADGGGPGAWTTGVTAFFCFVIFLFSLTRGEKEITRGDWYSLICCLSAIPLWLITRSPLYSVILITVIDVVAFWPTFRKSYLRPNEETTATYNVGTAKFILGIMALEHYSVITWLYPATVAITNTLFVLMVYWRRSSTTVKTD